tara:strand:- start:72 stop:425 length:354 start_codon:yes stop_codon:yes gene_type:complete
MTNIYEAIKSLKADAEFVMSGEPSTKSEYERDVKFVSGTDENGELIFKETQDFTWEEVSAKKTELQTQYDNNEYQRDRAAAYPSIQDQLDMQYWDNVNGTTNWKDAIAKVKSDNPKP